MNRYDALEVWVQKWQIKDGYRPELLYSPGTGTVGLGWLPLLEDLTKELVALGWNRKLEQVKEKFGGLRFYISIDPEQSVDHFNKLQAVISNMEDKSHTICEDCGNPGTPRNGSWMRTLCNPCHDSRYIRSEWHNV